MSKLPVTVRSVRASDFLQVLATLTEIPGRLTLTPDQLNWVLKECEDAKSAYRGWVATDVDSRISSVLIGKQKTVEGSGQFEILFLDSREPKRRETFPALIETLCESGSAQIGPKVVVFVPDSDTQLGEFYRQAGFQVHSGVPAYYADGSNAEIWTRSLATTAHSDH